MLTRHITTNLTKPLTKSLVEFDPTGFSGNVLWLDAADNTTITRDGSNNGTAIDDKSFEGNDATGTFTYDATGFDGKPTLTFNGSSNSLSLGKQLIATGTTYEIFVVCQAGDTDKANSYLISQYGSGPSNRTAFIYNTTTELLKFFNDPSNTLDGTTSLIDGVSHIFGNSYDGDNASLYLDGSQEATDSFGALTFATEDMEIGGNVDLSRYWTGNISEIIIYNRSLATEERNQVTNYLSNKWNITLN